MELIRLADGRIAKIVPADDAGEFRVQIDDFPQLAGAGATDDVISLARKLSRLWAASNVELRSRPSLAGFRSGAGTVEDRIKEKPWRLANSLIAFAGRYAFAVRHVVIFDGREQNCVVDAISGLQKILDTAGSILHEE